MSSLPHPLSDLTVAEVNAARDLVLSLHPGTVVDFRSIYLFEPPKAEVIPFIEAEHSGHLTPSTPRPRRLAQVRYDVIGNSKAPTYHESIVDVQKLERIDTRIIPAQYHASLTV